jgi:Ca2+-binding EF-hand superfamily protein
MKGNPEEKLSCKLCVCVCFSCFILCGKENIKHTVVLLVSFKLYDVNHDGYLTKTELERVMLKLVSNSEAI